MMCLEIAKSVPGRNHAQCLQRWRKVLRPGLVKGHWSYEEDLILESLVRGNEYKWGAVAEKIKGRTAKQCRERWRNHLDPSINKGPYTQHEDQQVLDDQAKYGNKWSTIATHLPGRTEDSVKIRWKILQQPMNRNNLESKKFVTDGHRLRNVPTYPASAVAAATDPSLNFNLLDLQPMHMALSNEHQHGQSTMFSSYPTTCDDLLHDETTVSAPHQPMVASLFSDFNSVNFDTFTELDTIDTTTTNRPPFASEQATTTFMNQYFK